MACNFRNVLSSEAQCKENPAGLSSYVMIVPLSGVNISVNEAANTYTITPKSGDDIIGWQIDFKAMTGQVTSEDNGVGKGWAHTGTGRVELNEDEMALFSRTLHNMDKFICAFPTGQTVEDKIEWKVVGNPFGECEWSVTADSGAARSDDHGQTFSVTCGYQLYPVCKFYGDIVAGEED